MSSVSPAKMDENPIPRVPQSEHARSGACCAVILDHRTGPCPCDISVRTSRFTLPCHNLCMFNVSPVLVLAVGGLTAAQARYRVLQVSLSNDLVTNPSSLSRILLRCAGHSEHSSDAVARDMIIARASLLFVELSVSFHVIQILERKPLDLHSVIALVELS